MVVNYYVIALMLRVSFMKYIKWSGGRRNKKKKEDFFWCIMKKSVFYPSHCKRKKRSLWNTLQQFGTHTEQFHFRASSELFQWMLVNKGNLHWKFLQEHRPFHVSQQGSSAFTPGLLLFLSLFLCSSPFCLAPTPQPALSAYHLFSIKTLSEMFL